MNKDERRIIGLLMLLLGLTALAVSLMTNQTGYVMEFMKKIFEASIAGLP